MTTNHDAGTGADASPLPTHAPESSLAGGDGVAAASHDWQLIDSAPKDGTWFLAFRPTLIGGKWQTLVCVRWHDEIGDFVWPEGIFDYYSPPDLDERDERGNFIESEPYESGGSFTHWMPLPTAPQNDLPELAGTSSNGGQP